MKPFRDPDHLIACHEGMFGAVGRRAAEILLQHAPTLFAHPIDALSLRVVAAPEEMGPYSRRGNGAMRSGLILLDRQLCDLGDNGELLVRCASEAWLAGRELEDFIVHELTHVRQRQIIAELGIGVNLTRGMHRDEGWYRAISEAAPKYLGVTVPERIWPRTKSQRVPRPDGTTRVTKKAVPGTLPEPEMTHWPGSLRALVMHSDPRLARVS